MAISRAQLAKELEPGLNALFGMEYGRYENQHSEIYTTESSDRAFEEEVMLTGFGAAPTKSEGSGINFDEAGEAYTARYNHETVALAFSLTEEAVEDSSCPAGYRGGLLRIGLWNISAAVGGVVGRVGNVAAGLFVAVADVWSNRPHDLL